MEKLKIRGVNLGNWLVLEKWMSPSMFEGTTVTDEYHLARALAPDIYKERIRRHRKEFITEQDFAAIARMGLNTVRIPIPYSIFGDRPPFIGCIEELDQAFDWAERWGLKILIDLHTVPGSQNGFDNGGLCGVCKWASMPKEVEFVLDLLEKLSERYGKRPGLFGIQPVNEPLTPLLVGNISWEELGLTKVYVPETPEMVEGSALIDLDFLRDFYVKAYRRTKKQLGADKYFVFHDGFEMTAWKDFMQEEEFTNVILDTHIYLTSLEKKGCEKNPKAYKAKIRGEITEKIEEMSKYFPVVCGEWCVSNAYVQTLQDGAEKDVVYRMLADEQLEVWEKGAGYFYWSYKLIPEEELDCWDLGKTVSHGWFPVQK